MKSIIEVRNLSKKFASNEILRGIDLTISPDNQVALTGPNGAGKTTLIRSIMGNIHYKGMITVFGENPRDGRVKILDRLGFVPQYPPPIHMRVCDLISFAQKISKKTTLKKIKIEASILGFDIDQFKKKTFLKLSGGMKQKLLIVLALAKEPDILIMDEPAANLDPDGRNAFFKRIEKAGNSTAMLLSSHRLVEMKKLVNRIIEMDDGKIIREEVVHSNL